MASKVKMKQVLKKLLLVVVICSAFVIILFSFNQVLMKSISSKPCSPKPVEYSGERLLNGAQNEVKDSPLLKSALSIENSNISSLNNRTSMDVNQTKNNGDHDNRHLNEDDLKSRREVIKGMMRHAWNGYVKFAWGFNELRPLSEIAYSSRFLPNSNLGLTIVDALDTLYIMDLKDEFTCGRQWVEDNLDWDHVFAVVSVFEVTIRYIGGLLSTYALTNDKMFLEKAEQIGNKLLPAFQTRRELPMAKVWVNDVSDEGLWQIGESSSLAEVGSLHLEFVYLSDATKNPIFKQRVYKARDLVSQVTLPDGLYPNYIDVDTAQWKIRHVSFGASGDSFYEYLLKAWIQSNKEDKVAKEMFINAMNAAKKKLWQRSKGGLYYLAEMRYQTLIHEMEHLTCFAGGMFALAAKEMSGNISREFLKMGEELADTCHESYVRTATGLGPEQFSFVEGFEAKSATMQNMNYILRPEVVETYFYLWRITKNDKYRNWAWDVVIAINKHCRVENGFSGINNVYKVDTDKDDVQQSFFLAETLKYLYLIFADDDLLPLDKWVFNTEAHPLPIKDRNDAYRS